MSEQALPTEPVRTASGRAARTPPPGDGARPRPAADGAAPTPLAAAPPPSASASTPTVTSRRPEASPAAEDLDLPLAALVPSPGNRPVGDEAALQELADSIRIHGLLHRIQVRPAPGSGADTYEIIAGERRFRALAMNGAASAACRVHRDCDDARADQIRIAENEHRLDPSAYDVAVSLRRIKNGNGWTAEAVASTTGMGLPRVKKYLAIFQASDRLLAAIESHRLPIALAAELVRAEKQFGEASTRKLIGLATAGELSARDLERRRRRATDGDRKVKARDEEAVWAALARRARRLVQTSPTRGTDRLRQLVAELTALLDGPGTA